MKIKTKEDLLKMIDTALGTVSKDERYPESANALQMTKENAEYENLGGLEDMLCRELHEADAAYPMHSEVAKLITAIYLDFIEDGDAEAMNDLGVLYYTGRAGEQDYEKAAYYYDMADKAGNRQATENLGYIYYYGRTGKKDYEKAFKYFIKGALDGHLRSLYKVGDFYRNGYYVEKDPMEAFIVYTQCLNMLTDEAMPLVGADIYMRIGDCLYEGIGSQRDPLGALHFMSRAENLFYKRLMEGDFYQQQNLKHVLEVEEGARKEINEKMLPDLSWAGYEE